MNSRLPIADSQEEKRRWPRALGMTVGNALVYMLWPYCERIEIAGSIRRGKAEVGDVEILYVPKFGSLRRPGEMFESEANLADVFLNSGLLGGKLEMRPNVNGVTCWGPQNKLAVHKATGMPVDLFSTTAENWWVALVIRTGPKELNVALCQGAKSRGMQLHAYGVLERLGGGGPIFPQSEREVFGLCGVRYLEPEERR
jgi:DNA polymerase/3'-5' exonuclease PolX